MKKLKITIGLYMRTCIYHPQELAIVWSGHIHVQGTNEANLTVIVGRCKFCKTDCSLTDKNYQAKCSGCFGIMNGLR